MPKLVWSSDPEEAKRLREEGKGETLRDADPSQQNIRVSLDRKRRAGKTVTLATGFDLTGETLQKLATSLKKRCGAGGTAKDREIEIQGDHLDMVVAELARLGYRVRKI